MQTIPIVLVLDDPAARGDGGQAARLGYTLLSAGSYLNFTPCFSLLFSAGGSVAGARHAVVYLGLYWTWGPNG